MAALFNSSFNNIDTAALPGALASVYASPTVGSGDGPGGINTLHTNGGGEDGSFGWLPNISITAADDIGLIINHHDRFIAAQENGCLPGRRARRVLLLRFREIKLERGAPADFRIYRNVAVELLDNTVGCRQP